MRSGAYRHQHTRRMRLFSLGLVLALGMGACGRGEESRTSASNVIAPPSTDTKPLPVRVQYFKANAVWLLPFVADAKGFFKKNALDAKMVAISSTSGAVAALVAGDVDLIAGSPEGILPTIEKGLPLQVLTGATLNPYAIIVQSKFPPNGFPFPQSIQVLKGKTIGVNGIGTSSQFLATALMEMGGLKSNEVNFAGLGGPEAVLASFTAEQVDAAVTFDPVVSQAVATKKGYVLADLSDGKQLPDYLRGVSYTAYWAKPEFIKSNPQIIDRFRSALQQTQAWLRDPKNLQEAQQLMAQDIGSSFGEEVTNTITKRAIAMTDIRYSADSMAAWVKFDLDNGFIKQSIDPQTLLAPGTPK